MHHCIVKSVFRWFSEELDNFTQFTLDTPQWFRQCGAGPGLATDNLPGCEAELGTRTSDWLRPITWPQYCALIGHHMPVHVSQIVASHWLLILSPYWLRVLPPSSPGSPLMGNIQSSCSLGPCSLCSDWLLWSSLKACYWSVVRWCQDEVVMTEEVWRRRTVSRWQPRPLAAVTFTLRAGAWRVKRRVSVADIWRERDPSSEQTAINPAKHRHVRLSSCPHLSSKWKLSCCHDVTPG